MALIPLIPLLFLDRKVLDNDMKISTDILIVGGGVSGSACGAALMNSGYKIICIDQGTGGPLDTSRGDHISPANVAAMDSWGVLEDFFSIGATKRVGHEFRSSISDLLLRAEYSEMGISHPYFLVVNHEKISSTFLNFAQKNPDFTLLQPYSAKEFDITDGDITKVRASNKDGELIEVSAHIVIACDGATSSIRSALSVDTFEHPYTHPMVAFFSERPDVLKPDDYFFRYSGDYGQLVIQQRMDGTIKITMPVGDEGIPWWKKSTNQERIAIIEKIAPELSGIQAELGGFYPVRMIHAIDYAIGNTVLIGDAAHAIHPARGQGLNMGIASMQTLIPLLPKPDQVADKTAVRRALGAFQAFQKPLNERIIARNHSAAMDMEMGADDNRAFVMKKQNEFLKVMASDKTLRAKHLNEATGYHFGAAS
ncbi:MAG: hypothetical protein CK518_00760 [Actinobacteria bacterium]|nr:MAG: hypothetical protein CK518_00760 [Actinomycetota bacterium]